MGGECYVKVESCIECVVSQENGIYTTPICVAMCMVQPPTSVI